MPPRLLPGRERIPLRVIIVTAAGVAAALLATLLAPSAWLQYAFVLWLVALLPPFLLAYYRGLSGAAIGFLFGITALAGAQVLTLTLGYTPPRWPLFGVVAVALVLVAAATGIVAELLHRERERALGLAFTDDLTGLPNRRYGRMFLEHEFAAAVRGRSLIVVLFDLDDFKGYNDRHGHAAGDVALRAFGERLAHTTRRMNLSARYGGEEFLSVLSGSDLDGALSFVERVRVATERMELARGDHVTVSAGVVAHDSWMGGIDDLIAAADRALYHAKKQGRNRVIVASPDSQLAVAGGRSVLAHTPGRSAPALEPSFVPEQEEVEP